VLDLAAANHTGREFELMVAGKKPLAMFYAEVGELPDEALIPEKRFAPYVKAGEFIRDETTVEGAYHPRWKRNVMVKYVLYALRAEAWRIPAMVLIMNHQVKVPMPNEAIDRITGALLGYTEEEIDAYCAHSRQPAI
jgi:hypothetical protein